MNRKACIVALLLTFIASMLPAQVGRPVPCSPCKIEVVATARLGDEKGPGIIDHIESRVARNSRGQYVVKSNYPVSLSIFDRNGNFVRTFGRKGNGPGEFQGIGAIAFGVGDSLHVFDQVAHRFSVYDADFRFVNGGILPLGPELSSLVLPSGQYVFGLPVRTPAQIGQPLHRVDRAGKLLTSFGSRTGLFRPDIPYFDRRAIAVARGGFVWSAFRTHYVLERWNPVAGTFVTQIRRDVPWFASRMKPTTRGQARNDSDAPESFLMAIRESSDGVLWVLVAIPDEGWRGAVAVRTGAQEHPQVIDEQRYYDTVIEAFDAKSGRLLASVKIPQYVRQFVSDGEVATVIEDELGIPRVHLWRVALKPQ